MVNINTGNNVPGIFQRIFMRFLVPAGSVVSVPSMGSVTASVELESTSGSGIFVSTVGSIMGVVFSTGTVVAGTVVAGSVVTGAVVGIVVGTVVTGAGRCD